jgi:signal transduction histidine kinase
MYPPPAAQILIALLALFVAAVNHRVARAPGWRHHAPFVLVAVGIAAFALGGLPATLSGTDGALALAARLQLAVALFLLVAWCRYADGLLARPPHPVLRILRGLVAVAAIASLLPGLAFGGPVRVLEFPGLGPVPVVPPTALALAIFALGLAATMLVGFRFLAAWRRGTPLAGAHAAALAFVLLAAASDALVTVGAYPAPFLLDLALTLPLATVTWALAGRIVADARALHDLRDRLDLLVDERTRDLARTQEALQLSGRLASLGHFAAGVAHEVNNPASVVSANLRYLADHAEGGTQPPDARESLSDALASMKRINDLVRRLVDAGRLAGGPQPASSASVAEAARHALADARARAGARIRFHESVPGDLHVQAKREVLQQVLGTLLANAADSVPEGRDGRVEVRAVRDVGCVRITVEDDGTGMPPEVLRRAFEPFYSTKPAGAGSGLGLTVSQGLARNHGGELRLESEPGRGTRAVVELPEAAPRA